MAKKLKITINLPMAQLHNVCVEGWGQSKASKKRTLETKRLKKLQQNLKYKLSQENAIR